MTAALDAHITRFNIIAPAVLLIVSIILAGTAIKTASFFGQVASRYSVFSKTTNASGLLSFDGLVTFLWAGGAVAAGIITSTSGPLALIYGPLGRLVAVSVLWILWLAGAAALSDSVSGLYCSARNTNCSTLRAAQAFSWIGWVILTLMLAVAIYSFITGFRSGNGLGGSGPKSSGPAAGGFTSGTIGGATDPSGLEMGHSNQQQLPVAAAHQHDSSLSQPNQQQFAHHQDPSLNQANQQQQFAHQQDPSLSQANQQPYAHQQDPSQANQQQFAIGSPVDGATAGPAPTFPQPTHSAQPTTTA